jgi:tetratricopeptide (TPR) repeat protein
MAIAPRCFRLGVLVALALAALLLVVPAGQAKYAQPDLVKVPIERLIANLEDASMKQPKNAGLVYNLARLHAMAYARKVDEAEVWRGNELDGVWFGYEARFVPFTVEKTTDAKKLEAAKLHLREALSRYDQAVKMDPNNLGMQLGRAWVIEQSGDKEAAITAYRKLLAEAWKTEAKLTRLGLGRNTITIEAAGYLIPLLDKDKDKEEIATLRERVKKLESLPRPITPLVVPLAAGLSAADLEDRAARVAFDADGSGLKRQWTWITPKAGWLVYDPQGKGEVTSALQMFGSVSFWLFWDNGYQALAALDDNGDGELTGDELRHLAIWQDVNGNGICDPGEVRPLSDWGIVALSCRCQRDSRHPDRIMWSPTGVRFRDGSTRPTFDLVLHPAKR